MRQLGVARGRRIVAVGAMLLVAATSWVTVQAAAPADARKSWADSRSPYWVGAWGVPPATANHPPVAMQSFRMILHPTIGGEAIRLRFSNAFGDQPLELTSVSIAHRMAGAAVDGATSRSVTFGGRQSVIVPPHGLALSDPVGFRYAYGQDLAVTFYVPGVVAQVTGHGFPIGVITSYTTPPGAGDTTGDHGGGSFSQTTDKKFFFSGLDAFVRGALGTVVALGDSITEGVGSTRDGNNTWPDLLAGRLNATGIKLGVVNAGIGGNTVLPCPTSLVFGEAAVDRFDRDVLQHPNVRTVIINQGGNDLRYCPTAAVAVERGLQSLVDRTTAQGFAAVMTTYVPRVSRTVLQPNLAPDALGDDQRQALNDLLRRKASTYDGFIDFDAVIRDPNDPGKQRPESESNLGDGGIHPGPGGYRIMAGAVPLDLLERLARARR